MKFFAYVLICSLCFFAVSVFAGEKEITPGDFASGYHVTTDGSAAIYRVPLPETIYNTVVRKDIGDIRVFNRDGQRIPHAIRTQDVTRTTETVKVNLPFFPLYSEIENPGTSDKLDITVDDDGTIVKILFKDNVFITENAEIGSYIVDLSSLKQSVDELEFEITGNDGGYIKHARIESSDDLNTWSLLVQNAALSELVYGNHSLKKNSIGLAGVSPKYLRFTWQGQNNGIQIKSIYATLNTTKTTREKHWSEVTGVQSGKDKHVFEFDTGGVFPIEQINIVLPEDNTVIEATLRSRNDDKANWRSQYSGLLYKLHMQGIQLENEPINVRMSTDRYWQLELMTEDGMAGGTPSLQFAWMANDLYFLARGDGPYTIAFGNANIESPGKPIDSLMRALSDDQQANIINEATLGEAITLKGEAALKPDTKIPWQRILLWLVLIVGVFIIAGMALRLYRQINQPEKS